MAQSYYIVFSCLFINDQFFHRFAHLLTDIKKNITFAAMKYREFIHEALTDDERTTGALQKPVLVALSGGADSVALLRVLLEADYTCYAAHCNFHLRGEESMRDERFVRDLCQRLDVPLAVKDFDVTAWQQAHGGSVEMACRELRYTWFEQERQRLGCQRIAVAHHSDDQEETFFLNLLRGTGTRGLAGMRRLNGHIWRPLLGVSRNEIVAYLASIGQQYVTDSTNVENNYRRNQLRNIVLPSLHQQFPDAHQRIVDTMSHLRDDAALIQSLAEIMLPDPLHIDSATLSSCPQAATLLYHRIRHMGFNREQCRQAVAAATQSHSGRQFTGNGYILHVNRQALDIEDANNHPTAIEVPIDLHNDVLSPVKITVSHNNAPFSPLMCDGKTRVAFSSKILDCQHVVLRHWRRGDRIKPFGMRGSKLISDLFADMKLDTAAKHATWLLEADGSILWVLGYRASALFPILQESQDYLLLDFQKVSQKAKK